MRMTKLNLSVALLLATVAATADRVLAQPQRPLKPADAVAVAAATSKSVDSPAMAETEAKLAGLRELVRPKPGEYATNIAKNAWERDPWEAAVRAGKEGKPVIAYGPGMVGVPCGYG